MAYLDSLKKSLLTDNPVQLELIEEADLYLLIGEISQEEYDEAITFINEHFGA